MGVFSEFERAMIQERVKAGSAARQGPSGRSRRRPSTQLEKVEAIKADAPGRKRGDYSSWPSSTAWASGPASQRIKAALTA